MEKTMIAWECRKPFAIPTLALAIGSQFILFIAVFFSIYYTTASWFGMKDLFGLEDGLALSLISGAMLWIACTTLKLTSVRRFLTLLFVGDVCLVGFLFLLGHLA